jgi:hypothetical protein
LSPRLSGISTPIVTAEARPTATPTVTPKRATNGYTYSNPNAHIYT